MRPNAILETSSGARKVMLYIFSRHFMLRCHVQLRLNTENDHFLDEEPRFSTQMLLWDQIWGTRSYHFLGKSWFCSISTSVGEGRALPILFQNRTFQTWFASCPNMSSYVLLSAEKGENEVTYFKMMIFEQNGNFWYLRSGLRDWFETKILMSHRKNVRSQRRDGVESTTGA